MRSLREFAEQQAETVQEAQREQFATLTLNTAVELTAAALQQVSAQGGPDEQAIALRDAMRVLFPEAVALVSAARQGFMREGWGSAVLTGGAGKAAPASNSAWQGTPRLSGAPRLHARDLVEDDLGRLADAPVADLLVDPVRRRVREVCEEEAEAP